MIRLLRPRSSLLLTLFLLFGSVGSDAQATWKTTFGTGAVQAVGSGIMVTGTIGQAIAGTTRAARVHTWQGFWTPVPYARLSSTGAVAGDATGSGLSLRCAPNPILDPATVHISLRTTGTFTLALHDLLGREVMNLAKSERASGDATFQLDPAGMESGWYSLVLVAGEERASLPVHIVR